MSRLTDEQQWDRRAVSLKKARNRGLRNNHVHNSYTSQTRQAKQFPGAAGPARFRNKGYDIVPPVRSNLKSYSVTHYDDGDSWGEASEGSDAEDYRPIRQRNKPTFPLPRMSFGPVPVQHPGSLGYKIPSRKPLKRAQPKRKVANSVLPPRDVLQEVALPTDHLYAEDSSYNRGMSPFTYSPQPPVDNEYTLDSNYQYIRVQKPSSPLTYDLPDEFTLSDAAVLRFSKDPVYARNYTENFIETELRDQIIPDLLIEVLGETYLEKPVPYVATHNKQAVQQYRSLPYRPLDDQAIRGALIKQPASLLEQAHVSKQVADELLAEVITDELGQLVRDTSMQHITRYIREDAYHSHINNLIDEETINAVSSMFKEIKQESEEETIFYDEILQPVLDSLTQEVAVESIQDQDDKRRQLQATEINRLAGDKLQDGILLDHLLTQLITQEEIVSGDLVLHYTMDSLILDVLLRRLGEIDNAKSRPLNNTPVRRFHERVVTDLVLDLLLNELCLNLDEDIKDYDEYESGLIDYQTISAQLEPDPANSRPLTQLSMLNKNDQTTP